MSRDETVSRINEVLEGLKDQGYEPRSRVYSGPEGLIDVVVYDITSMDPKVEFVVHREDEFLTQSFDNLTIAFVYLFGQTPHIQREDKKRL